MNGIETSGSVLSRISSSLAQGEAGSGSGGGAAGNTTAAADSSRPFSGLSGTGDSAEYTQEMKRRMRDRLATSGMEGKVLYGLHCSHGMTSSYVLQKKTRSSFGETALVLTPLISFFLLVALSRSFI